jgi:hypothetical protein
MRVVLTGLWENERRVSCRKLTLKVLQEKGTDHYMEKSHFTWTNFWGAGQCD